MRYVIGLGTNLGDRMAHLESALDAMAHLPNTTVVACSSVYETAAVGYTDQPDFLNLVLVAQSELSPHGMLGACLGIEAALGRVRTFQNAPRVIDADILLVEGYREASPELTVPHPRMWDRAFVICPLLELEEAGKLTGFELPQGLKPPADQKICLFPKKV